MIVPNLRDGPPKGYEYIVRDSCWTRLSYVNMNGMKMKENKREIKIETMNRNFATVAVVICLLFAMSSCDEPALPVLKGIVKGEIKTLTIGEEEVAVDAKGSFEFNPALAQDAIWEIEAGEESFEVYVQPGSSVEVVIEGDKISFKGDLTAENNHLITDKTLNVEVSKYLRSNWYGLHSSDEAAYRVQLDSLKTLFVQNMVGKELSDPFVALNKTSINYGFDRMLLRYPQTHFYFTGEAKPLSTALQQRLDTLHDVPEAYHLSAYRKFVQSWLDNKLADVGMVDDSITYKGGVLLQAKLDMINKEFQDQKLKDFWTLAALKTHVEQYAWINGEAHLKDFLTQFQTQSVLEKAREFQEEQVKERVGHDIYVYKTAKGQKLEAHVFKPDDFDTSRRYPALAAFHGGGWASGNAGWTFSSAQHAAETGMIGVAVEYRLSNRDDITPVEAMADTRDLMIWLRANADRLRIQPDSIVGKGISAGGHLISSVTVMPKNPASVPNALVLVSPALDTSDDYFKSLIRPDVAHNDLSSVENVSASAQVPPTLILQGETDRLTPTVYAVKFKDRMDSLGYHCKLVRYPNVGHLFTPSHLDDTGWPQTDPKVMAQAIAEQDNFLRELGYLK